MSPVDPLKSVGNYLEKFPDPEIDVPFPSSASEVQKAVLAGGCFWCVEAVYRRLEGVIDVVSGYTGDSKETAEYKSVCSGATEHAEAVEITFNAHSISFGQLLKVFFGVAHDPTTLNRQGADVGKQYRSAIFYINAEQRKVAEAYIEQLGRGRVFDKPIVTEVTALGEFYSAEDYHQDYARLNPSQPYIQQSVPPKLAKLEQLFGEKLR